MTAGDHLSTGAASPELITWDTVKWAKVFKAVRRLQMRIAKATRERRFGKVKALQRILTHSFFAKLWATKRITQNPGKNTPGVDGILWTTSEVKMQGALSLKRQGYRAQPLKRVYIQKKSGGQRPLSIPTLFDRGMQALYLLAFEPIVETLGNKNAYGFRPKRSTADAIEHCFKSLAKKASAQWILEGDIRACFDSISFSWLEENLIIDKKVLNQWLKAGYIEDSIFYNTLKGTPQGGVASPAFLNATLSGLESLVKRITKPKDKVHICIYADDFIITGSTKEILEQVIKPAVETFLAARGLELSPKKTKIVHIQEGFDFLGFSIRKYKDKLLIKPSKDSIKRFLEGIRQCIKDNRSWTAENLISLLNPKLRGWGQYFHHCVAKEVFRYVDAEIFKLIWRWCKRRHPTKSDPWIKSKYFRSQGGRNWIFFAKPSTHNNAETLPVDLLNVASIPIRRHIKIKADATPYDPAFKEYFKQRDQGNNLRREPGLVHPTSLIKARAV